jgi:NAD(P)-dependent dehydrogenase (short-subunit alcohol dehydrogenase family)
VAVVSGGHGLGRSFCLALARQGAKVVVSKGGLLAFGRWLAAEAAYADYVRRTSGFVPWPPR